MLDTPRRWQAGPLFSCPSTLALPGLLGATNLVLPADSLVPPDTGFGHPIAPDLCKLHRTASTSGGREFIRSWQPRSRSGRASRRRARPHRTPSSICHDCRCSEPASPDPWAEATAYAATDLAHKVRYLRFQPGFEHHLLRLGDCEPRGIPHPGFVLYIGHGTRGAFWVSRLSRPHEGAFGLGDLPSNPDHRPDGRCVGAPPEALDLL